MFRRSLTSLALRGSGLLKSQPWRQVRLGSTDTVAMRTKVEIGVVTSVISGGLCTTITYYVGKKQLKERIEAELSKFEKELEMKFEDRRKQMDFDDARNFVKFRQGHHIPSQNIYYEIDRPDIERRLKRDILSSADSAFVKNIIGDKGMGKSTTTAKVAKTIEEENKAETQSDRIKVKIFYLNASDTLRNYLESEYKLLFEKEEDAVRSLMTFVRRYGQTKPKNERVIVILDSPGGIDGDYAVERLIKGMKDCVSANYASFYCVTSLEKNIFATKESKKPFGDDTGRFEEAQQNEWIDFKLNKPEMTQIIKKYQEIKQITFSEQELKKINHYTGVKIGHFVNFLRTVEKERKA